MDSGHVRQAIIDTWEGEPNINPTLLKRAFISTPHIAGYSADGKANATRISLTMFAKWLRVKDGIKDFRITPPEASKARTGLNYRPTEDSKRLKEHPEQFEKQRGNYPLRRE